MTCFRLFLSTAGPVSQGSATGGAYPSVAERDPAMQRVSSGPRQVHDIEHLRQFARDAVAEVAAEGLRRSSSGSGLTFGELVRLSSPTNYESVLLDQPKMYEQGPHRDRQSERLSPAAVETSQKADERIAMLQQRLDQVRMAFPKYPRLDLRTLTCAHIHRNRL